MTPAWDHNDQMGRDPKMTISLVPQGSGKEQAKDKMTSARDQEVRDQG